MDAEITAVLVKRLECCDVGSILNDLIDPFNALDHLVSKIRSPNIDQLALTPPGSYLTADKEASLIGSAA